jgi:outer membrane protein assembly factor BamB
VYTLSKHGMAYCLDVNDGDIVWENDLSANYGVRKPNWGFAGSPYVDGNLVIYNVGTHGLALHTADGTLAWQTGTERPGYSTPVPFHFQGQDYVVLMGRTTFAAVRVQTGEALWEKAWETSGSKVNAADPVVDGNLVFVSSGYSKGSALFDVSTGQVTQLWFETNMRNKMNSSVLWQGYLYGPNDKGQAITCVQRSTGRIMWSEGGFGNGSVTLADGKLIILSQSGQLCIAEPSSTGYREKGRGRILTGTCWSVPVLANGKIYARNATGNLVCVKLEKTGPEVDAGSSIITWLKAGTTTVDLSGAVTDATGDVTSILWSVISSPPRSAVYIANDSAATTTATFAQTGSYVLQLQAIDATAQKDSDRMQVTVYADSCEAAKNNPNSAYVAPLYDFDDDCMETLNDFAMFTAEWLQTKNFNDFATLAAEWLQTQNFNDFATFVTKWLQMQTFNDFAVFADEWLEDECLTDDVPYEDASLSGTTHP